VKRVVGAQELGKRVAREAEKTGIAPERLRKWIASAALLELFNIAYASGRISKYCVKGGFAVELRNPSLSRASQDIDVVVTGGLSDRELLEAVISEPWELFSFRIKEEARRDHSTRLVVQAIYNNVAWTTIKFDLVREPIDVIEDVDAHDLTVYGLAGATPIPCLSRWEQMAQYIHAISLPAVDGKRPSRARNIVDIYVFDQYARCDDHEALSATIALFERRDTHAFPPNFDIPDGWHAELATLAAELGIELDAAGLIRYLNSYLARILGVPISMKYEYRFLVLSALPNVPSIVEGAIKNDPALDVFNRMTQQEGFKLAQLMRYPSRDVTHAMLAVLERPIPEA
jgi:hypothetical protein